MGLPIIEGNSSQKSGIPTEFLSKFFRNLKTFAPLILLHNHPQGFIL